MKSKPKTYNSFVSPGAKFEYEIDIMDIEAKGATSDTRYGLVAIDNLLRLPRLLLLKIEPLNPWLKE